jgi:hypothetical protein
MTIPLDLKVFQQLENLAAQRGMRVEKMVSTWLKEKLQAASK